MIGLGELGALQGVAPPLDLADVLLRDVVGPGDGQQLDEGSASETTRLTSLMVHKLNESAFLEGKPIP